MQVMTGIFKIKSRQTGMRDAAPAAINAAPTLKIAIGLPLFLAGMPITFLAWHNIAGRMRILGSEAGW